MALTQKFSIAMPVEVAASGGILVRQVDTNGVALDDGVTTYSVAIPVMPVTSSGVNEDTSLTFGVHRLITSSQNGIPVVRVGADGTAVNTSLFTVAFTPASLFASSEKGGWYDPSDLTTLFQDSAGTTAVTTVGQSVGMIKDKSGNANHLIQATAGSRPTYQVDGNGKPYLLFDGVDDQLSIASMVVSGDKATLAFMFGVPNLTGNKGLFGSGTFLGRFWSYVGTANDNSDVTGATGTAVNGYTNLITTTPQVLLKRYDLASATIAASILTRRNAVDITPSSSTSAIPGGGTWQAGAFAIGNCPQAGVFGNYLFYGCVLRFAATTDVSALETWAGAKVNLTL